MKGHHVLSIVAFAALTFVVLNYARNASPTIKSITGG